MNTKKARGVVEMKRNESFDEVAKLYDQVRPSYPEQLIGDIISTTRISLDDKLLEIGAGTGKATILLAQKGFNIHCIELGQNLADILLEKCNAYKNVTVDVNTFEKWKPKDKEKYKLIYSAQAFHWIDPQIKFSKCHDLLSEGGHIALFWYKASRDRSTASEEIDSLFREYAPEFIEETGESDSYTEIVEMRRAEIESSGLFKNVELFEYTWENKLDAITYIKVLNTYSKYTVLDTKLKAILNMEIERIINKHGGFVISELLYYLFIAEKK